MRYLIQCISLQCQILVDSCFCGFAVLLKSTVFSSHRIIGTHWEYTGVIIGERLLSSAPLLLPKQVRQHTAQNLYLVVFAGLAVMG